VYVVGYGSGDTPEQAESRAQVNAAAAISSQIHANLKAIQSESSVNSQHTSATSVSDEVVREVETDAGAFIQPVRDFTTRVDGGYQAVAVASREELDGKYGRDAARLLDQLLISWDRALAAADKSDQMAVVSALCDTGPQVASLDKIDRERRLVTRRSAWTPDAAEKRHLIEALQARMKSTRVSVFQRTAVDGVQVSDALVRRLGSAGYDADLVTSAKCEKGGLLVRVAVDESCGTTILGQRCEVSLAASSERCGGSDSLFDLQTEKVTGMHATDPQLAERAALRKLDAKTFVENVAGRVLTALEGGCRR